MTEYPSLKHISIGALIGEAGGDPWQVDQTLQSGDPGAINDLGRAFYSAGACTAETYSEFAQAQQRFQASWNRENGEHPINDSAEVQRATTRLMVQRDQLPAIGVDLSNIAATLAETQRFSGMQVENLNTQLHYIDALIDQALAHDQDTSALEDNAITVTSGVLHQVEALRDDYGTKLNATLTDLRAEHGYDPAPIEDVDGDGEPGAEQRGRESTDYYDANQRAKDEALVNSDGPMTPEKADAAARLRDFATATNPSADADARRLAGERLDDFRMAHFTGPLPTDPMVGGDARSRARTRLEWQQKLEQGAFGTNPLTPDQVTQLLDDSEQHGRVLVTQRALDMLQREGVSKEGAEALISKASSGIPWNELVQQNTDLMSGFSAGVGGYAKGLPVNAHDFDRMSLSDVKAISEFGKYTGRAATIFDAVLTYEDIKHGKPAGQAIGEFAGGTALGGLGAWGTAIAVSSVAGPEATFAAALVAGIATGELGKWIGGATGGLFDK
ncbi:hypothetical protein [Mycolicibacterium aichiense]|uniref:Predicted hydrolase N-terminal domain-containing protein n=2 Tax=Mycolicibacterium TaxID=1866885 RepID=A0AAD1MEN4_9MYCO|nr:hypothetical protein [Mycolicibacterium aichiense]MCV7017441.1 hypothetical protein [Mycolicibacterium aichiense]BBX10126.1 hypothetical protein MAIC_49290 [Mycolicibacterium aichiense]STZ26208.1 Uncharacterised protein [Mycolicibacterium aichiense]